MPPEIRTGNVDPDIDAVLVSPGLVDAMAGGQVVFPIPEEEQQQLKEV